MLVAQAGEDAAPWCPLDESSLKEERLVDVFDGVGFLADGDRQRGEADRTTVELVQDEVEDLPIHPIEALVVHLEEPERLQRLSCR